MVDLAGDLEGEHFLWVEMMAENNMGFEESGHF